MARHTFLGDMASWVMDTGASATSTSGFAGDTTLVIPGITVTFWSAASGGSQYTDLLNATGTPITSVISAADGSLPQISGPDAVTAMWADASGGAGPRRLAAATDLGTALSALAASAALTATTVKTASYTASPGDFVPVDTTGGPVTITLPSGAADQARVGVKLVRQAAANTVTVACPGTVTFNDDATTAIILKLLNQGLIASYSASASVWYIQSGDLPLTALDARYSGAGVVLDTTATDIQPLGTQAAGSTGKGADAGHVHPTANVAVLSGAAFTGPVSTTGTLGGSQSVTAGVAVLTFGTTITVNASLAGHFRVTLTASTGTIANPTSPTDGQKITFEIIQDATGGRSVAWGTAFDFGTAGTPPLTATANKRDLIGFCYSSSASAWLYAGASAGL